MPLYDYECKECRQQFEHFLTLAEDEASNGVLPCPVCGEDAVKIIVLGHGGFMRPDSGWVRNAARVLSDSDKPLPIENTTQLRRFLESNPNIKPKESHPALPSRLGDSSSPETESERHERVKKAAWERVRDMRSINITSNQPSAA